MTLVIGADAAYPFNYDMLPPVVRVILGYVGGDTPHIWSDREIATASLHRQWWAIWTAPNPAIVLSIEQGRADAAGMIAALKLRSYNPNYPVFYDIEQSTYSASPSGAHECINAWKDSMHGAGYAHAYAYVPWSAQFDWVANWVDYVPSALPRNCIGWQYRSLASYDLSIFDSSLLGLDFTMDSEASAAFAKVESAISSLRTDMQNDLVSIAKAISLIIHGDSSHPDNLTAIQNELAKLSGNAVP